MPNFHTTLLEFRNLLGYQPPIDLSSSVGICSSIEVGGDAFLLGEKEYKKYWERLNFIYSYHDRLPELVNLINNAREEIKSASKKKKPLAMVYQLKIKKAKEIHEIASFMEQGELYARPKFYTDLFSKYLCQQQLLEIAEFSQPENLKSSRGRIPLIKFANVYTRADFENYLFEIIRLANFIKQDLIISISTGGHRIILGYRWQKKEWFLMDYNHQNFLSSPFQQEKLSDYFFSEFKHPELDDAIIFSSKLATAILNQSEKDYCCLYQKITEFLDASNFLHLREITTQRVKTLLPAYEKLVLIAANCSYSNLLKKLLELINESTGDFLLDVNRIIQNYVLVCIAACNNDVDILCILIDAKNLDGSPRINLNIANSDSETAVFMAIQDSHVDSLHLLINAKNSDGSSRVNLDIQKSNGATPVFRAAQTGQAEALRLLLNARKPDGSHRADPNKADHQGLTPAHIAASNGNLAVLKLLDEHGADLERHNPINGEKPADLATKQEVINFFTAYQHYKQLILTIDGELNAEENDLYKHPFNVFKKEIQCIFHNNHELLINIYDFQKKLSTIKSATVNHKINFACSIFQTANICELKTTSSGDSEQSLNIDIKSIACQC
jgi:ankyrin repeat protein